MGSFRDHAVRVFAAALAVATAIAAADLAAGGDAVLIELLVIAPLIAALGAGARRTAIAAGYAVALSVPLGLLGDDFLTRAHLIGIGAVGIGGILSVTIASLRDIRERDSMRLAVQYGLARVLAEADSLAGAEPRLLEAIGRPLGWEVGSLWQEREGVLRCEQTWHASGVDAAAFERATREASLRPGEGLPGRVWETGETAWRADVLEDDNFVRAQAAAEAGLRAAVGFPVRTQDGVAAVIEFFIRERRPPDPGLISLMEALATQIGDFVRAERHRDRNLQLQQAARLGALQARDQLESILRGVADGVTAQASNGQLIFANDAAARTLGYDSVPDLLAAPLEEVLGRFEILDEDGRPFPLEQLPGRRALLGEENPEALLSFRIKATGEQRWSVVKASPVRDDEGDVVMAINVFEDITEHKLSELRQRFLSESTRVLASSLDPDETLGRVADLLVPEVADWVAVDLKGPGGTIDRVALAHADPQQRAKAEELRRDYPPHPDAPRGMPNVLRTGRSELYPDIPDELLSEVAVDERHLELMREFGFRSGMVVPLKSGPEPIGALTLVSGRSGRRFDERDLQLAEELAARCATAIENARLYSERAHIAKTLQDSLLPAELPAIPGFETAARFRASGEGTEVGGDFYDLFQTSRNAWAVVVGDVCGKGPDAAAVTALARYTLRAAAMREHEPSRSLRVLNEALLRQRRDRRFCTVAYARLVAGNGSGGARVGFASGGHPLPLLLRADGRVRPFGFHGTLLGVVPDPRLQDCDDNLQPGDTLIFYTDGVTEAGAAGDELLGERRLEELVSSCAGLSADEIAGRIEAAAVEAQRGEPRDDIAVLVLQAAG